MKFRFSFDTNKYPGCLGLRPWIKKIDTDCNGENVKNGSNYCDVVS